MATPPGTLSCPVSKELALAMSPKKLAEVQEVVLREYPFLESVYEAMLLTDCALPDCPIVFANDFFERMTLYPKEEIIGRNCRFLQGPHTNPNTIKTIRAAVHAGQPLDVELLNYRKDGVPFMNCFLMLPIHKRANPKGRVTHFLAIQKDVTLLRPWEKNPSDWSPSEVSMWLDKWGLIQPARILLQANITGGQLLNMSAEALARHGVVRTRDRTQILDKLAQIKLDPALAYAGKVAATSYRTPTAEAIGFDSLKAREWWKTARGANDIFDTEDTFEDDATWSDDSPGSEPSSVATVAAKLFFENEILMEFVPLSMHFKKAKRLLEQKLRARCTFEFHTSDGETCPLRSDADWRAAIRFAESQVLRIVAAPVPVNVYELGCSKYDYLGAAVLVATSRGQVVFSNTATRRLLGDVPAEKHLSELLPALDASTYIPGSWTSTVALHQDGHSVGVMVTMTENKNYMQYYVIVPSLTIAPVF